MKRIVTLLVIIIILSTGCIGTNKIKNEIKPYPATVLNVTIQQMPKSVVSLSPAITEVLVELGYKGRIKGISVDSVAPEGIEEPKRIGTALIPDFEAIGEIAPEIIFTNTPLTKVQMEKVSAVSIKVIVMPTITDIDQLQQRYGEIITAMEGNVIAQEKMVALRIEFEKKLKFIEKQLPEHKPNFILISNSDFLVATGDVYEANMLSLLAENNAQTYKRYEVNKDILKTMNPEIIFYCAPLKKQHITENELFKETNAVKNDQVFLVDAKKLTTQKKDIIENIRDVAKQIYPSIDFTQPEEPVVSSQPTKKKWYEFYKK